jgi:arylsulfatase A-like enzyme
MAKQNNITRKQALKTMGGLALGGSTLFSSLAAKPGKSESSFPNIITSKSSKKPNILWITGEGVPISVLSTYQNTRWGDLRSSLVDTPNIDRIAKEGMQMQNSFCTNALCAPSRATLITGKYSHENGVTGNINASPSGHPVQNNFDVSQETLPKIMRREDYQTALMGKWHIKQKNNKPVNPGKAGFDKFAFKTGAGTPYYGSHGYLENPKMGSTVIEKKTHQGYNTDVFTDLALQTLKTFKSNDKPFFMMMQYFNDHRAFTPPHKYDDLYKGRRIPEPSTFWDDYKHRSTAAKEARMRIEFMPDWGAPDIKGRSGSAAANVPKDMTGRQRKQYNYQQLMKHFLGTLKAQDDNIGRLLHFLDQSGLADNTIVVYTSDHGFFLGEHGWFDKRFMFEQALRVPWMIRWPGKIKPGSTTDLMGVNIDNAPTALDLAGLPVPDDMQGRSLKPILQGKSPSDWRTAMYYHYYEYGGNHWVLPNYGIRTERYKLISYYTSNEWELFDLEKDPDEMESLFKWNGYDIHPGYEKIAHNLVNKLKQMRKKYNDHTGQPVHLVPTRQYD